ncbi:MAG: 16S rRNA (guanine(966)-N(2))-methyltransferase RsmD [Anaerolineales bacterium]|nr:16S rRNA (guanine(966)-N(2))-methyltransferase RsmD [Anaerolineales bacterium]
MTGLRVISGKAKGRRLHAVPGDTTRPITDRTKESLFNIIGADIIGASFLDLFAGTGAVGIEALSRGASRVRFIDVVQPAIQTIKKNLKLTQLENFAEMRKIDAFKLIESTPDKGFDYIYIAPPQYKEIWKNMLIKIDKNLGWLAENGWVIVQIHPTEFEDLEETKDLKYLEIIDQRRYGSTLLMFYRQKKSY